VHFPRRELPLQVSFDIRSGVRIAMVIPGAHGIIVVS
jgi:hypothetical protein